MKPVRSLFLRTLLLFCLVLPLFSCSQQEGGTDTASLYEEAARLYRQKKYPEALDRYNKALAADTLHGFSSTAMDALCRKNRIEFLTGTYSGAFRTWDAIRRHADRNLPDSLHTAVALDTGRMYAELGMYGQAASVMATLRSPDAWQRLDQASLLFRAGSFDEASRIYGAFSASEDPVIRMAALSGLLDCALSGRVAGLDTPDNLAGKIAMISGRAMSMNAPPEVRIRALRIAAKSLEKMEKQRPNASYLLFRALAMAQESGFSRLVAILQHESNNIIVRKPDTWRSVIEYFGQSNMTFAKVAALYMLGRSPELTPAERIEAYRNGLEACRYYGIPATADAYVRLEREAAGELEDLLAAEGRYTELFDAGAMAGFLEQQRRMRAGIAAFRLPPGNEAMQNEIIELNRDISGLLQRQINMIGEGTGFRLAWQADKAIREKQSRLIELITEASRVDETVASRLQPRPVTLRTLQKSLTPDQAMIRLFIRDSLSTAMLVSGREMHIVTARVPGQEVMTRFGALRQHLASAGAGTDIVADEHRIWLTDTLLQSMGEQLAGYQHLIFVAQKSEPFHVLGRSSMIGQDHQVSWLLSESEVLVHAGRQPDKKAVPDILFFNASNSEKAEIHKLFHPRDKVFLAWKTLSAKETSDLKTLMKRAIDDGAPGSDVLKRSVSGSDVSSRNAWMWLGSYGAE
jgi:tetratricopeptide (TPR) repeat protein